MCEISKSQRRTFRDQDPPRIRNKSTENLLKDEFASSRSTPSSPTTLQRAGSLEKCFSDPDFFKRQNPPKRTDSDARSTSSSREDNANGEPGSENRRNRTGEDCFSKELNAKVTQGEVVSNGVENKSSSCNGLTNGREMAPVLGVPPPPPAPHMGPDGLVLPRKPYNPYLNSTSHKDLHRELLFNQKVGKSVLNQKSELQRAMEKQREAASRKEAERCREESYKDDPRTALQRALEQRAKQIQLTEQPQSTEPPNPLVIARAKLRTRTDSQ